jgi:hypothetical protein
MRKVTVSIILAVFAILSVSTVHAKRAAPAKAPSVSVGQIEYRAPRNHMGCVEAWDSKSNEMIWRRQIYVVKYTVGLERDVQDVFITMLKLKGNTFIVTNEWKSEYELDLNTLQVKVLKGALVENHK